MSKAPKQQAPASPALYTRPAIPEDADLSYIEPELRPLAIPLADVVFDPNNANTHDDEQDVKDLRGSLAKFGQMKPIVVNRHGAICIAGEGTCIVSRQLGRTFVAAVLVEKDALTATGYAIADNETARKKWNLETLSRLMVSLRESDPETAAATGFNDEAIDAMAKALRGDDEDDKQSDANKTEEARRSLAERFGVPPFSVLNAQSGYWMERKKAWLKLGIDSAKGRGFGHKGDTAGVAYSITAQAPAVYAAKREYDEQIGKKSTWDEFISANPQVKLHTATSVFDPVLCEIAYRWFCPAGGAVLDPFAGESTKGLVAAHLGFDYTGIELRAAQVEINRSMAEEMRLPSDPAIAAITPCASEPEDFTPDLTPVEKYAGIYVKRDDLFCVAGVRGGKVRSCWHLAQAADHGLVTAGSRSSPQVNIVAHIARRLGLPCRVHVPQGELSPEVEAAQAAGAEIVQHRAGYNTVIVKRARDDAKARGWTEIPFGMECEEAMNLTRAQVANLPFDDIARIVVPVGSGMTLAGVLWGLHDAGRRVPVVGVQVGAEPLKRLQKFAPSGWEKNCALVESGSDYHAAAPDAHLGELQLDPHYEAKCLPFLQTGDLLWCVGIRQTAAVNRSQPLAMRTLPQWICGDSAELDTLLPPAALYDFIWTSPPYYDLEIYSESEKDGSAFETYEKFMEWYEAIFAQAVSRLKDNRFLGVKIGEVRDKKTGAYRNFVGDNIACFRRLGLHYYNEAILVTPFGSAAVRAGKQFVASRKLAKVHQNILFFYKGDLKTIKEEMGGEIEFALISEQDDSGEGDL